MHRAAAVKRRDSGGEKDFGKGGGGLDFLARLEEVERKDGDAPSAVEPVRHQWPGPAAAYLRAPAKNVPEVGMAVPTTPRSQVGIVTA